MEALVRTLDFLSASSRQSELRVHARRAKLSCVLCCGAKFDYSLQNLCPGHRAARSPRYAWLRIA